MNSFNFSEGTIFFSSLPTKFERKIFKLIVDGNEVFPIKKLTDLLGVDEDYLLKSIEKFQKKVIIYKDSTRRISTNIITGYERSGDILTLILSKRLEGTLSKDTFSDFKILFNLTDEVAMRFYLDICKKVTTINENVYSIDELKTILKVDKYDRFYDFEKFILKKLKKSLEEETPFHIAFEKIKEGGYKNSKVSHVKVIVAKKSYHTSVATGLEILSTTTRYNNKNLALVTLMEILENSSKEDVVEGISNFVEGDTIEKSLKIYVDEIKEGRHHFKCIFHTKEYFSNIIKLQNKIFTLLKGFFNKEVLSDHFITNDILKALYALISKDKLTYENKNLKIQVTLLKDKEYDIKIYTKEYISL